MGTSKSAAFAALSTLTSSTNEGDGRCSNLAEILGRNLEETEKHLLTKSGENDGTVGEVGNAQIHSENEKQKNATSSTGFTERFVRTCFDLLSQICLASIDAECPWSVKEEAVLKRTLQLLVALGILPDLHAYVGIPLHQRTLSGVRFADFEQETSLKPSAESQNQQLRRLNSVLLRLWHLCGVNAAFANLVVGSHFSDLLVGLVQVGHEPLTLSKSISPQEIADLKEVKREARKIIAQILDKFFLPIVFQELLLLLKFSSSSSSPPPPWYKKTLCILLSTLIIRPHGFLHLVASIGDSSSSSSDGVEAKKYEAIAELLSTPPSGSGAGGKKFDVTREYFAPVCDQLLQMLDRCVKISAERTDEGQLVQKEKQLRLVSHCITKIDEKYPMVVKTLIVDRILAPVVDCIEYDGGGGGLIVDESTLDEFVGRLLFFASRPSKLILGSENSSLLETLFSPIVHFLFQLFCFVKSGVSRLKQPLKDILDWYLKTISGEDDSSMKNQNLTSLLEELLFTTPRSAPIAPISFVGGDGKIKTKVGKVLPEGLRFESGPNGGVVIKVLSSEAENSLTSEVAPAPDAESIIWTIREFCESFSCAGDFLLLAMQRLGDDVADDGSSSSPSDPSGIFADEASDYPIAKILTLRMIDALGAEASTPAAAEMVVDDEKIIAFAQLTCRRCLIAGSEIDRETMSMTFGLISAMIIGKSFGKEQEEEDEDEDDDDDHNTKWTTSLRTLIPIVEEVEKKVTDPAIKEMATNTLQLIKAQIDNNKSNDNNNQSASTKSPTSSKFELALKDLDDPLVPVRGHALLVLSKLIASKDEEASERKLELLEIFMENLLDDDTYIYLNAVKGLEALALAFPDRVLKKLCEEFVRMGNRGGEARAVSDSKSTVKSGELVFRRRLNLGESIARTCRELGEMTPAYLPLLLNALLNGVRDDDSYIRASSLSTLGEALEKARFAVAGNSLFEILATLSGAAKLDSAPEVRRGAVLVIRNMLQGLGVDAMEALGGEVLKELYRLLKRLYEIDNDDVVRLQAQLAFEALDVLMRDFLFPKETLVKKISVLSVCDS